MIECYQADKKLINKIQLGACEMEGTPMSALPHVCCHQLRFVLLSMDIKTTKQNNKKKKKKIGPLSINLYLGYKMFTSLIFFVLTSKVNFATTDWKNGV